MNKLRIAVQKAKLAPYNEEYKAEYKRFALSVLRAIARDLQLAKESYSIRFNPGGIAVSGDATLHSNWFYLTICEVGVMWRTCEGQKDYHGGPNQWAIGFGRPESDQKQIVEQIKRVCFRPAVGA